MKEIWGNPGTPCFNKRSQSVTPDTNPFFGGPAQQSLISKAFSKEAMRTSQETLIEQTSPGGVAAKNPFGRAALKRAGKSQVMTRKSRGGDDVSNSSCAASHSQLKLEKYFSFRQ